MEMKCFRCHSERLMKFVDGFGERRVYCRRCAGSFLEQRVKLIDDQKRLTQFDAEVYKKLDFHN